jgi:methylenetetrahydrofolate reductase (NADPH)
MLRQVTQAARVAHLTLVGQRREDLVEAVQALLAVGAEAFMVLRGDPPGGPGGDWVSTPGGLTYAVELVELVRQLSSAPVGVAAFPYGHPTAPSLRHDAAVLAGKQEAGADFAISQVVFDAAAYFGLRDRSELAGATLPIIPGIMPVSQVTRVDRLELYSGAPVPAPLLGLIERASSGEELDQVGIAWSVKLVQELLRGGAPGVHFYTLNSCPAAEAICRELGLTGRKSR